MADRPHRPLADEHLLLHEIDEFSYEQGGAIEALVEYADKLELYADDLDEQINQLMGELGSARYEASGSTTVKSTVEDLAAQVARLTEERDEARLRDLQTSQSEAQYRERTDLELTQLRQQITNLSQELAFNQVQLGGIRLILR